MKHSNNLLYFILLMFMVISQALCQQNRSEKLNDNEELIIAEIQNVIAADYQIKEIKIDNSNEEKKEIIKKEDEVKPHSLKFQQALEENKKKLQARYDKEKNNKKQNVEDKQNTDTDAWILEKNKEFNSWIDTKKEILDSWIEAKKIYHKKIPQYKQTLVQFKAETSNLKIPTLKTNAEIKNQEINIQSKKNFDYFVIKHALSIPSKDQGRRPTCAAFAAIRAIEILYANKKLYTPLSEQYFYWASKPNCKISLCSERGSWPIQGFEHSKNSKYLDIPANSACPYNQIFSPGNETQIPLKSLCQTGITKVKSYSHVKTLEQIIDAIRLGFPVIAALKLDERFYKNDGYIFIGKRPSIPVTINEHAAGHAVLFVGMMQLPQSLWKEEGKVCLITANSWGLGWGKAGHSCISEKWIEKQRFNIPFIALEEIEV